LKTATWQKSGNTALFGKITEY